MRMMFGEGKIAVCTARLKEENHDSMIVFLTDAGSGEIGAEVPNTIGREVLPDDALHFHFSTVESVQVLIDALEKVKTAISSNNAAEVSASPRAVTSGGGLGKLPMDGKQDKEKFQ